MTKPAPVIHEVTMFSRVNHAGEQDCYAFTGTTPNIVEELRMLAVFSPDCGCCTPAARGKYFRADLTPEGWVVVNGVTL